MLHWGSSAGPTRRHAEPAEFCMLLNLHNATKMLMKEKEETIILIGHKLGCYILKKVRIPITAATADSLMLVGIDRSVGEWIQG